ncbi:SAM-dependent methyltransferase [Paucilactobacillus sp. N302-9]
MTPKQLKKLKKQFRQSKPSDYITQMNQYLTLFENFPSVKYLINNVLESDRLLKNGLLPQPLPQLILPDNLQDQIYAYINEHYDLGDPKGDQLWNQFVDALPKLDRLLRNFRDYLEQTYGMWSYVNAPFVSDLSKYIAGRNTLEVMAGNGYISSGLRNLNRGQTIFTTDNQAWRSENATGNHPVTQIEKLDALSAFEKYKSQIDFVIMSWSPDKLTIDWQLLQAIRDSKLDITLITIGEQDGATGSHEFWSNAHYIEPEMAAKLSTHLKTFDLIDEQVYLVK